MPKFNKRKIYKVIIFLVCIAVIIAVPIMATTTKSKANTTNGVTVLTLWQIDSFEGGKGSRASYLQSVADEFSKETGCYIVVTALSADAARHNLKNGNSPELISYGAGTYGLEGYISGEKLFYNWCYGGYCFLTLETGADFSDVTTENLVINSGTGNLVDAAALLCGVNGADKLKPTGAYVQLINGEYKYLLGTQRDIFRLKTRGVEFTVKPVTEFNDLYQNISVTSSDGKKKKLAESFINFLLTKSDNVTKLGLMSDGRKLYDDEMREMEGIQYEYRLTFPISETSKNDLDKAILNCDVKNLKNLLN